MSACGDRHLFNRSPGVDWNNYDARDKRPTIASDHEGLGNHEKGNKALFDRLQMLRQMKRR